MHDMLGLDDEFRPRHARRFMEGAQLFRQAFTAYREAVQAGEFPTDAESFYMDDRARALIERMITGEPGDLDSAARALAELDADGAEIADTGDTGDRTP